MKPVRLTVSLFALVGVATLLGVATSQKRTPLADVTVAHVGVIVRDIDKSAKTFEEVFGVSVPPARASGLVSWPENPAGPVQWRVRLTSFQIGGVTIELVEPVEGPGPHQAFLSNSGEGLHHIALMVPDRSAAFAFLKAQGGRQVSSTYIDMKDVLGFTVEPMARAAQ